jgi:hypothetical protein
MMERQRIISKLFLLAALAPVALEAQQIALSTVAADGTETAVGAVFGFGQIAAGDTSAVRFRARGAGAAAASVTSLAISAPGGATSAFSFVNTLSLPLTIPAAGSTDFTIQFSATAVSGYSATLQINAQSVMLLATVVGPPSLTVAAPCTGPSTPTSGSSGTIGFGGGQSASAQAGPVSCLFTLQNTNAAALPVAPLTLTGSGFMGLTVNGAAPVNGVTIPGNQTVTFTLTFTEGTGASNTGTLVIGTQTFALNETGTSTVSPNGTVTSTTSSSLGLSTGASASTATAVGSTYDFSAAAVGDSKIIQFWLSNPGASSVTLTAPPSITGAGFALNQTQTISAQLPLTIAPASAWAFWVEFSPTSTGAFTGGLSIAINGQTAAGPVTLTATGVDAPTISVGTPCSGPTVTSGSSGTISFGQVKQGGSVACVITLQNTNAQALVISPLSVAGSAFSTTTSHLTIAANQSAFFTLTFAAPSATSGASSGTLVIGTRTYSLTGTGFVGPLPTPVLTFDSASINSGEQHTLTIALPTPATVAASGTLTLTFNSQVTGITDDTAIQFVATSKRVSTFAVQAGATAVTLDDQPNILFSTGTTAGRIVFTMAAAAIGFSGDPTATVPLAPAEINVSGASATSDCLSNVEITMNGFDNTYTAGGTMFSFYDLKGALIGSAVPANFSSKFQSFYLAQTGGSAFLMGVTFPVTGDITQIGAVNVTLTNAAGSYQVPQLTLPTCTP